MDVSAPAALAGGVDLEEKKLLVNSIPVGV